MWPYMGSSLCDQQGYIYKTLPHVRFVGEWCLIFESEIRMGVERVAFIFACFGLENITINKKGSIGIPYSFNYVNVSCRIVPSTSMLRNKRLIGDIVS